MLPLEKNKALWFVLFYRLIFSKKRCLILLAGKNCFSSFIVLKKENLVAY